MTVSMPRTAKASAALFLGIALGGIALASGTERISAANVKSGVTVRIPARAVEVAPHVFSLGTATADGQTVEGYMIVDRRKEEARQGGGKGGGSKCYAFLGSGAKWREAEPWLLNPSNGQGFTDAFLLSTLAGGIGKWEGAAAADLAGEGSVTVLTLVPDEAQPDGLNEVVFGSIDSPGAIAVTIVWGVFGGSPQQRKLVEWDQVFDEADYAWSAGGEAGKMDFENIATHELGHALGMGHPADGCTEETMYRLADFGETKKRDLFTGDVAGVRVLYR